MRLAFGNTLVTEAASAFPARNLVRESCQPRQRDELLLERPREAAAAQIPAVELLQEAERTVLAELPHGLAHEQHELRDDLFATRLGRVAHHLAEHPRIALRGAADHHGG